MPEAHEPRDNQLELPVVDQSINSQVFNPNLQYDHAGGEGVAIGGIDDGNHHGDEFGVVVGGEIFAAS